MKDFCKTIIPKINSFKQANNLEFLEILYLNELTDKCFCIGPMNADGSRIIQFWLDEGLLNCQGIMDDEFLNILNAGDKMQVEKIVSGKDYSHLNNRIVNLHALKTNECKVMVEQSEGQAIEYPPGSFVRGNLYPISFSKIIWTTERNEKDEPKFEAVVLLESRNNKLLFD